MAVKTAKAIYTPHLAQPIKTMQSNDERLRFAGHLVRFGKPEDRDFDGEWFSKRTWFMQTAGYPIKGKPVNFQHGSELGAIGIGS
jgi:hypothetical protein